MRTRDRWSGQQMPRLSRCDPLGAHPDGRMRREQLARGDVWMRLPQLARHGGRERVPGTDLLPPGAVLTPRRKGQAPPNKGRRFPPEPLSLDEARAILEQCSGTWSGRRAAALIAVLWRAGLRLAEALALEPKDVDIPTGTVEILHGKGDKARTVGLDPRACTLVAEWLSIRPYYAPEAGPLFCTRDGGQLSQGYVRALLSRLAASAGIRKRVHPHGLRHTMAREMVREGLDIVTIQRQLGHSKLATTQTYVSTIAPEEVIAKVRKRTW